MKPDTPTTTLRRTAPQTPRSATHWKKRYADAQPRGPGLPATHIDDLPSECRKIEFWSRKQGAEALSIFYNDATDKYYVHLIVPSKDWTYGPFDTQDTADAKLDELRHERDGK